MATLAKLTALSPTAKGVTARPAPLMTFVAPAGTRFNTALPPLASFWPVLPAKPAARFFNFPARPAALRAAAVTLATLPLALGLAFALPSALPAPRSAAPPIGVRPPAPGRLTTNTGMGAPAPAAPNAPPSLPFLPPRPRKTLRPITAVPSIAAPVASTSSALLARSWPTSPTTAAASFKGSDSLSLANSAPVFFND